MWVIFAILDPDLDSESGSGYESTDLIEYGSGSEILEKTTSDGSAKRLRVDTQNKGVCIDRDFHSAAEAATEEGPGGDPPPRDDPRLPLRH